MKPRLAVAGALALGLALTGCRTNPGAAAVIGSDSISNSTLRAVVARALANPVAARQVGANKVQFERQELARLIEHRLIVKTADDLGVTVSRGDVEARLNQYAEQAGGPQALVQQAEQNGIPQRDLFSYVQDLVTQDAIAQKLVATHPLSEADLRAAYEQNLNSYNQVHAAHILVASKKQADALLAQVRANPASFAALAKRFSTDPGSKANGGDLGFAGPTDFVQPFAQAIFRAKPGSFLEVHTQFGWHVVHVIAHRTTSFKQAEPELRASLQKNLAQQLLQNALRATAKKLGVSVNPRYGTFDPAQQVVQPLNDKLSKPASRNDTPQQSSSSNA